MKDPVGKGIIAGIIGVIAINIVEYMLTLLNISETALWEAGGIVFLSESALETPLGIAIGIFSHLAVAIFLGVGISYYIHYSGIDFAVVKGIGISYIALFIVLGLLFPLRGLAIEMQGSPGDVLAAFIDHTVFGALGGYIIKFLQIKNSDDKPIERTKKYVDISTDFKEVVPRKQNTSLDGQKNLTLVSVSRCYSQNEAISSIELDYRLVLSMVS